MGKWYNEQEDSFLKENYTKMGAEFCSEKLNRKVISIYNRAHKIGLHVDSSYRVKNIAPYHKFIKENPKPQSERKVNADRFINGQNDSNTAYICGVLWADGHITSNPKYYGKIALSALKSDVELYIPIFNKHDLWNIFYHKPSEKRQLQATISTVNTTLANHLHKFGYVTKRMDMTNAVNFFHESVKHHWWRGFFDGDGCFYKPKYSRYASVSACYNYNWKSYTDLLTSMNIKYCTYNKISQKTGYGKSSISFTKKEYIKAFGEYLYKDSENCRLERKYQKWLECIS